ncbi:MAG: succinylglutamate desuccinylase/aspartoacylase family protein [Proteobacteria bacterium]|nr:succinylglutamate desuccinylase/aspartoacylase family protein [Pseudomonadota bacterium]
MTYQPRLRSTPWQAAATALHANAPAWRSGATVLAVLALAACSSTPLPPWPTQAPATAASAPQARRQVPPPLGTGAGTATRAEAVTTPVTVTPIASSVPGAPGMPAEAETEAGAPDQPYGAAVAARFPDPSVRYETPGLAEGRRAFTTNAELTQWLLQLAGAQRGATRTQLLDLGESQRGTPIHALVLTRANNTDAKALEASRRPTVLLIGQQHGDEPAGGEALLVVARELAQGLLEPMLERINVIVVPRANPDGADAGKRVTANGIDMNRDHLLLQTPEAQALARLVRDYRPIAVIDAHEYTVAGRYLEKFHALQRYDMLLQHATTANLPEFMTKAALEWYRQPMLKALDAQGLTQEWYYTTSKRPDDLRMSMGGTQPDTGRNVNGLKNTVSMLLETRGIGIGRAHIQRRVHSHVTAVTSALRSTVERAGNLEQVRSYEARDISAQACRGEIVVEAGPTPTQRELIMLDPQTGADRPLRVDWNSSLQLKTLKKRPRPCGYWLAGNVTDAVERLKLLGVQVMRVAEAGSTLADTYQETSRDSGERQDVRGQVAGAGPIVRVQVTPTRSAIDVPAGSYYVPLNQPLANLAVAALEPDTQNSYFANHLITNLADMARVVTPPSLVFEETE